MSILAIDFDGVIHDKAHPKPGRRMGPPIDGAAITLRKLWGEGHKIIVHTVMATNTAGYEAVEDWMTYYQIPFDTITAIKPAADWYVDDHALRFIDWPSTYDAVGGED